MIRLRSIFTTIALLASANAAFAQGFINLNFESTTLATNGSFGTVSTATGLPGWTATIGGTTQSTILYDGATLGASSISILSGPSSPNPIIDGNFSVQLVGGSTGAATISQTGLVPANANSIFFDAYAENALPADLEVSLDGQAINIYLYAALSGYDVYAGNVSSFANQTAGLAFTAPASASTVGIFVLDDISFSPTVAPEPGTLGLSALGAILFGCRRCRRLKPKP